jgi:hypothetical protein
MFLKFIRSWHDAFLAGRLEDARWALGELELLGQMLALDHEFRRLYEQYGAAATPEAALACLGTFLKAVTDTSVPGMYRSDPPRG